MAEKGDCFGEELTDSTEWEKVDFLYVSWPNGYSQKYASLHGAIAINDKDQESQHSFHPGNTKEM